MGAKFQKTLMRGITVLAVLFLSVEFPPTGALPAQAAPGDTMRVSVDSSGAQANGWSRRTTISGDGRYVAFASDASNLVGGDTNGTGDIFVHDRQTGVTTRVSVDSSGAEANGGSDAPFISNDGRYVAFYSDASNLASGDANGIGDIFVHDRQTGITTRVSVGSSGNEANGENSDYYLAISGDGRYVAFVSEATNLVSGDTNGVGDVFVHDIQSGQTTRASVASGGTEANGGSGALDISNDGRYVAFSSSATNLVTGDTNNKGDVFVHDRQTSVTTLVSVNTSGEQADAGGGSPAISGDGRYVVFLSRSNNLAPRTNESQKPLVYVHDRQIGQTTLASVYSGGEVLVTGDLDQPTISSNGRYVAFSFYDKGDNNGIMNIWVRDLQMGTSIQVTGGNESSYGPSLSADGSVVSFWSLASNLVSGDTNGAPDIFVHGVNYGPDRNPTVVSVTPKCGWYVNLCPYPSPSSVAFIVIFSEFVTGVTVEDFSLTMIDGISGASITGVSGYGSEYFVTVDTGTGEGLLDLDVLDDDSIKDTTLNPLGGAGTGNGNFTHGSLYRIDKSNPTVMSIVRADPNPTTAAEVHFTVTFSEMVWPVKPSDFVLFITGSISGASITAISPREDEYKNETTYTVTVNTGTGEGTLRLDLVDDDSIRDQIDNPLGGAGAGNGNFNMGEVYSVIKNVPTVTGSLLADPNPTTNTNVRFTVTFSENVGGVDSNDFALATTGSISAAFVEGISGSGNTYTVNVNTGTGDGTLRLDVTDNDSIMNTSGTPLGGAGAGNGNFTSGEVYTIDRSAPFVTGSLIVDPNPTAAVSVNFTVTFSEPVNGVDASDFFLTTTGSISSASVTGVSGAGNTYTISVGTGSGNGTLRLDIQDNDSITDTFGNPLGGAGVGNGNFTTGQEYTVNKIPAKLEMETLRSNGNNDGWVLESGEDSNQGGSKDSRSTTFVLGDDDQDRQFRAILHFPTHYLPDNAVITRALLMIRGEAVVGTDPFTTHQNVVIDIRSGPFGFIGPFPFRGLQDMDFQSMSNRDAVGMFANNPYNGWYWAWLDSSAFEYINLTGITQLRLRFQLDDDNDMSADYMRFYSGDYDGLAARPQLLVEYYTR